MISKHTLLKLLAGVVLTPVAVVLSLAVGALLDGMSDSGGASAFYRIAAGLGVAWGVALIALLLALAVNAIAAGDAWPLGDLEPPDDQSLEG